MDELTHPDDLATFLNALLSPVTPSPPIRALTAFYLEAREAALTLLTDGGGGRPRFSLRSLSRALSFTKKFVSAYGFDRALFEGISMAFLTQLDAVSLPLMRQLIAKHFPVASSQKALRAPPQPSLSHVLIGNVWLKSGGEKIIPDPLYIRTPSIDRQLEGLARIVMAEK